MKPTGPTQGYAGSAEVAPSYAARVRAAERAGQPLLEAARPLLQALRDTPAELTPDAVLARRQWLLSEARLFERVCAGLRVPRADADTARYCLCSALDEAAMQTAWGHGGSSGDEWSANGIATTLGYDRQGGDRVFALIEAATREPDRHADLLAVLQQIIESGFAGRYRFATDGAAKLGAVRARLGVTERSQANSERARPKAREAEARRSFVDEALANLLAACEEPRKPPRPEPSVRAPTHHEAAKLGAKDKAEDVPFAMRRATPRASEPRRHSVNAFIVGLLVAALLAASCYAAWRWTHHDDVPTDTAAIATLAHAIEAALPYEFANQAITIDARADHRAFALRVEGMFAPGKAVLTPSAETTIGEIGKAIAASASPLRVRLIGHTDNLPFESKTGLSNEALSTLRAQTVMKQLADAGVALDTMSASGSGEASPLDDNRTLEGRARNRRVEIVVESRQ
ncbi:DotU/TssL family secretion system protein [Paraburkholderia acidisoli]|uniref:OmpA family protein n=1 Tax=Paraburkholderia acidisoli TaxID=2571748 RepID=A0A7Z2GLQ2_9BURK|nr:DotU/TssL family secretion system protein [Paraburkholderia acidisoli]QGZ64080.1 OmpA family protein [Paraburkholderia acidisoli]